MGLDGYHGVGTALEGWVRIPKPGGVRKGWMKQYAIICDFKLFVHNIQADTPNMTVTHLFDIKYVCVVCVRARARMCVLSSVVQCALLLITHP